MSAFGKYGSGGSVPGKWPGGPNENGFDHTAAATGSDAGQPDSMPSAAPGTFGSPSHN